MSVKTNNESDSASCNQLREEEREIIQTGKLTIALSGKIPRVEMKYKTFNWIIKFNFKIVL